MSRRIVEGHASEVTVVVKLRWGKCQEFTLDGQCDVKRRWKGRTCTVDVPAHDVVVDSPVTR
jgi:hypothetical protein